MKILILTTSHPKKNAGIVASDLFKGLNEIKGNDVRLVTKDWDKYKNKNINSIDTNFTEYKRRVFNFLRRIVNKLSKILIGNNKIIDSEIKSDPDYAMLVNDQTVLFYNTERILNRAGFTPDIIIVLFMPHFLSFQNLHELNRLTNAPIYLYLMDMAPLTGGCHYAWDCKGYLGKCGNCPALFSKTEHDQSRINWDFKNKYLEKTNITAIAGTEWQYRQLQNSSLFSNKSKFKILLGIDDCMFKPGNKDEARDIFKLPQNKKIIFFGAAYFDRNRNKGFKELINALEILKTNTIDLTNIHIAIAGNRKEELDSLFPFDFTYLGYLNHNQLATAFQAADLFVSPSIEDSGPMMVNQSIMCGTPVVAFEMGVALDLVITGRTGYLAKLKNCDDLANGINYVIKLSDNEYRTMSENCRQLALSTYTYQIQIQKFIDIFNIK